MALQTATSGNTPKTGARRVIFRNFLSLTVAQVAGRAVGLFSGIYTRRILEVVVIGQISWCASIMSYFSLAINPGLETIAKRDVAREPGKAGHYVSVLLLLQLILAVAGLAFSLGFAALGLRGPQISLILTLQAFGLLLLPFNLTWLLQANERMAPAAFAEVVSQLLMLPSLVLFIHNPTHVIRYVLLGYPFRIGTIVYLMWYVSHHGLLRWSDVRPTLRGASALLKQALPLGLSQGAVLLYYNFDAVFLGFTRGDATVGIYSTAYNLMLMPLLLSGSLSNAYFPALSRVLGDEPQMKRTSSEFLRAMGWMGFPIAVMGWAGGRYVVRLMYGEPFAASGPLLEWLSLDIALVFFNVGFGGPLNAWGHQQKAFYVTLVAAILNVGLNCAFIPRYGVWAAVATTIIAEMAVMICLLYWRRLVCPIPVGKIVSKPIAASLVVGVLTRILIGVFPNYWWMVLGLATAGLMASVWVAEKETIRRLAGRFFAKPKTS